MEQRGHGVKITKAIKHKHTVQRSSPIQVPGTQWSKVSSGTYINAIYIQQ